MNKLLSIIALLLISTGTFISAQTAISQPEARQKLMLAKRHIVTGNVSEAFGLLSQLWQESVPEYVRGRALYLSATLAEYGIGRECNQPNAHETYFEAAELGNDNAKKALKRIEQYGFAEPTEANRTAVVSQIKYMLNREIFSDRVRSQLPMNIDKGFRWTAAYATPDRKYITLSYIIASNSPILAGANDRESLIEKVKSIPAEKFLKGWNIPELFEKMNISVIDIYIHTSDLGLRRRLLPSGEEEPIKITTRK